MKAMIYHKQIVAIAKELEEAVERNMAVSRSVCGKDNFSNEEYTDLMESRYAIRRALALCRDAEAPQINPDSVTFEKSSDGPKPDPIREAQEAHDEYVKAAVTPIDEIGAEPGYAPVRWVEFELSDAESHAFSAKGQARELPCGKDGQRPGLRNLSAMSRKKYEAFFWNQIAEREKVIRQTIIPFDLALSSQRYIAIEYPREITQTEEN